MQTRNLKTPIRFGIATVALIGTAIVLAGNAIAASCPDEVEDKLSGGKVCREWSDWNRSWDTLNRIEAWGSQPSDKIYGYAAISGSNRKYAVVWMSDSYSYMDGCNLKESRCIGRGHYYYNSGNRRYYKDGYLTSWTPGHSVGATNPHGMNFNNGTSLGCALIVHPC